MKTNVKIILALLLVLVGAFQSCTRDGETVHDHDQEEEHKHGSGEVHEQGEEEHEGEVTITEEAISANEIEVSTVVKTVLRPSLDVPGRVVFDPDAVAHVGSPLTGRVSELAATIGEHVSAGDVLAVIESPELGAIQGEYLEQRSAARMAAPIVELAKSTYERARQLAETEAVSRTESERRQIKYKTAQAELQAARSAASALESKLRVFGVDQEGLDRLTESRELDLYHRIRAPISGRVVEREVTLGELVKPEDEALFVLGDPERIWVIADVPESRAAEVGVGARARVAGPLGEQSAMEGEVAYVAPVVDPSTRTVSVRIVPDRSERVLRPGMFARVSLSLRSAGDAPRHPVLAVPEAAIQVIEGRPVVFSPVEGEANTFAKRAVTVGPPVGTMVPVLSGLRAGERVVVSGSFILKAELGKEGAAHEH